MSLISIKDHLLYVETYGDKSNPPLIFLHGGPGEGAYLLAPLAQKLGKNYFIINFDQAGCGRSAKLSDDEAFGMRQHVAMIEGLKEHFELDQVSVYGHGYGGMLACLYAKLYPQSVQSVIYDSACFDFIASAKSIARYLFREFFIYLDKSSMGYRTCSTVMEKEYTDGDVSCITDLEQLLKLVEDPKAKFYVHQKKYSLFAELFNSLAPVTPESKNKEQLFMEKLLEDKLICTNMYGILKENQQPSLMLVGKYDPICSLEQRKAFIDYAPNGEIVIFENSGSHPHLEEPDQHLFSIVEFLERVQASPCYNG